MESLSEFRKFMNKSIQSCQKWLESASDDEIKKLQRKAMECRGVEQEEDGKMEVDLPTDVLAEAENRENKLAEGRSVECEALGSSNMVKTKKEDSSEVDNEGGMGLGIGGVGKTEIKNKKAVKLEFKDVGGKSESSNPSNKDKKFVGMGGVGETKIENEDAVTLTFEKISF